MLRPNRGDAQAMTAEAEMSLWRVREALALPADASVDAILAAIESLKPKRKKAPLPKQAGETPAQVAWRVWRATYAASSRGYGPYVRGLGDEKTIGKVSAHAVEIAEEAGHPGEAEAVLTHWFRSYLRDHGSRGFDLKDHRHGLQWFERGIPVYGHPPSWHHRRSPTAVTATADPDGPIEVPADVKQALAGIGRPRTGPMPSQQRKR